MQAGSFVATSSSPAVQSTRSIAVGSWKAQGKVDRQLSLDRSVVSISGSFSQNTNSHQVPVKTPSGSTPWTPAPPRSPRQRTHSPLRWKGPQPAPASAVVLTRDPNEEATVPVDFYPDRLSRKTSLDAALRMPFLSMPATGPQVARQAEKTPNRAPSPKPSPRDRAISPTAKRAVVLDESQVDLATDRLLSASCRSPTAARPVPRISMWQQATSAAAVTSPHNPPDRPTSPFRWKGPQTMAAAPAVIDIEDGTSRGHKAMAHSLQMPMEERVQAAPWATSAFVVHKNMDESHDASQGPTRASNTQRNSRVPRVASPSMRARTLSPARRASPAVIINKEAQGQATERDQHGRWQARTIPSMAHKDSVDVPPRIPRPSAALIVNKDDSEVMRRPQASSALLPPKDVGGLEPAEKGFTSYLDLKPWLEAAQTFQMNSDFNMELEGGKQYDFNSLMALMKQESAGKWTIQTMADKLLLNGLLENLGLPHMPMIFASRSLAKLRERLEVLVDKLIIATAKKQPYDIIVKPTHLSSAQGVMSFNKVHAPHREDTIRQLEKHMRKFIETSAHKQESMALQSLKPGFIGQPKYKSVVGFKAPLELKVCCLFGKARSGVWWWGTRNAGPAQVPHRNVWIVRDPLVPGELSDNDGWEILHNHPGGNAGFDAAIKLFKRHMPDIAQLTETLATALGTPFLRADFFVGSPKWGVRLNEVAYGCGLEYRNLFRDGSTQRIIDDKPAMAEILRQGMALCHRRSSPGHFLGMLGVQGTSYEDTAVVPLSSPLTNFATTMNQQPDHGLPGFAVEEDLCASVKELPPYEEVRENAPKQIEISSHLMRQPHLVKPHPAHIPTLVMPKMTAVMHNTPHMMHLPANSMKAPMQSPTYVQAPVGPNSVTMGQPQVRAPMMMRAPMW